MGRSSLALKQLRKVQKAKKRNRKKQLQWAVCSPASGSGGSKSEGQSEVDHTSSEGDALSDSGNQSQVGHITEGDALSDSGNQSQVGHTTEGDVLSDSGNQNHTSGSGGLSDYGNRGTTSPMTNLRGYFPVNSKGSSDLWEKEAARYCQEARLERIRADRIEEDCQLRMRQVRCFWRDKIYRECSRSGKILKTSMQGQSYSEAKH
ncbi:hypothetical protein SPONL_9 [uncultured Candidatus Thioglobus sp.]|nr:hypothetical protein SPONL_9 [uncultured Candidatus Thioglobus sp.]